LSFKEALSNNQGCDEEMLWLRVFGFSRVKNGRGSPEMPFPICILLKALASFGAFLFPGLRMSVVGVRRDKAALSSGGEPPPGNRSSRKQSEQSWR
jgi:hypothetical protein